jgi:hypothetical protein
MNLHDFRAKSVTMSKLLDESDFFAFSMTDGKYLVVKCRYAATPITVDKDKYVDWLIGSTRPVVLPSYHMRS